MSNPFPGERPDDESEDQIIERISRKFFLRLRDLLRDRSDKVRSIRRWGSGFRCVTQGIDVHVWRSIGVATPVLVHASLHEIDIISLDQEVLVDIERLLSQHVTELEQEAAILRRRFLAHQLYVYYK